MYGGSDWSPVPAPRTRKGRYPTSDIDRSDEEWFRGGLGNMVRMFGSDLPKEFEKLTRTVQGPKSDVRERVGPFVYGFSYTQEPGKEPIFQEFGNIRPSYRGIEPIQGREPLADIRDKGDFYEISVELPGVNKDDITLDFYDDSFVVDTKGDMKFHGRSILWHEVNPDTAKASYRNGILNITVEKKEEWKHKAAGTSVAIE
jgi:HSP20 family protein